MKKIFRLLVILALSCNLFAGNDSRVAPGLPRQRSSVQDLVKFFGTEQPTSTQQPQSPATVVQPSQERVSELRKVFEPELPALNESDVINKVAACFNENVSAEQCDQGINEVYQTLIPYGKDAKNWKFIERIYKQIDAAREMKKLLRDYAKLGLAEYAEYSDGTTKTSESLEQDLKNSFLDLVDPAIRQPIEDQFRKLGNSLLESLITAYEQQGTRYVAHLEHRAKSLILTLDAFGLLNPELQNHFIEARFYRLIARYFTEPTEEDLFFMRYYDSAELKYNALKNNALENRKRTKANFDFALKQLSDSEQKQRFENLFNQTLNVSNLIEEDCYTNFKDTHLTEAKTIIEHFPLLIKNALIKRIEKVEEYLALFSKPTTTVEQIKKKIKELDVMFAQ
jgi:hypothetical protein